MSASAAPSQTPTLLEDNPVVREEAHEEHVTSGVDIQRAEQEFLRLERVATVESRREILRRRTESISAEKRKSLQAYNEEQASEPEPFDLREYLSSTNDRETAHGLKHRHVGVTWEDLEVKGVGGSEHKVGRQPVQNTIPSSRLSSTSGRSGRHAWNSSSCLTSTS